MKIPLDLITARQKAADLEAHRSCGECTACCVLPRIPIGEDEDFPEGKPGYTPCEHLCSISGGCGVYETRPQLCRDYKCLWRGGILQAGGLMPDESMRPDKLGLMLTLDEEDGKGIVEAWELWEGAASVLPGRNAVRSISDQVGLHIRFYGVPAAIRYYNSDSLQFGRNLSRWAREDPKRLAAWLAKRIDTGHLIANNRESVERDLEPLRRGEPVARHYQPK